MFVAGIGMMSIVPEYQGQGLGSMLMEALIGKARSRRVNIALAGAQGKFIFNSPSSVLTEIIA